MTRRATKDLEYNAKGDILVGTGDNEADNLPVGPDGKFPISDTTQPMGMQWGKDVPTVGIIEYLDITETTPPGAPAGSSAILRLYAEDFHGFSFFSFVDDTGMRRKIVRDSVFVGRATEPIAAMQAVYAVGSTGNVPTLGLAKADNLAKMPAIGVAIESMNTNNYGRVMQVGLLESVDTHLLAVGSPLYVSAVAGVLTITPPLYPAIRQEMGTVLVSGVGNGAIQCVARSMLNEGILDHRGLLSQDFATCGHTGFAPEGGLAWSETTGTTQALAINRGYILNNVGLVTATLPVTAAMGTRIYIVGKGAGGWKIAQNAGQYIFVAAATSTLGIGGSVASSGIHDCVELLCTVVDTAWTAICIVGTPTVV